MIDELTCPLCEGPMTRRKGRHSYFFGCNAYPVCQGTRNEDGEFVPRRSADPDDELPSDRLRRNDRHRWRHE